MDTNSWIRNPTSQGAPKKDVARGDSYSFYPRDGSVARFFANSGRAGFSCDRNPLYSSASRGVPFCAAGARFEN